MTHPRKKSFAPSARSFWLLASLLVLFVSAILWLLFYPAQWSPTKFGLLLLVDGLCLVLLLWLLPNLQADRSKGSKPEDNFGNENEARKTLAQIIGGALVLAGLYSSFKTFNLQREGQITDRFTKAIEQLGAVVPGTEDKPNLEVRLGGIYALERIAKDSPADEWTIMEVLTAYVHDNSPLNEDREAECKGQQESKPLGADIQAALTVIKRRQANQDPAGNYVEVSQSQLRTADFRDARFAGAHLIKVDLYRSNLSHADFSKASFQETYLCKGATLDAANLSGANFSDAMLEGVDFSNARLSGATFSNARLFGSDLSRTSGLVQGQLDGARGDGCTKLPEGMVRPLNKNWIATCGPASASSAANTIRR